MTFAVPFAIKVYRCCRCCGDRVLVWLLNGATCPRDPYFTCSRCISRPEVSAAALDALERPQLQLVPETEG